MVCQAADAGTPQTGPTMTDWRMTQVRLSAEARDQLDRICLDHGVTLTALIEALGLVGGSWLDDEIVARARQIDRDRRSR